MPFGAMRHGFTYQAGGVIPTRTAVTITAYGNAKISTAQSKFGGASALFDGSGDYLDLNENIMPVGAFTIEMWYRPSSLASVQTLWSNFLNNEDGSATLWVNTTGQVNFYLKSSNIVSSTTNLVVNTWYHIAVRKNSSDGYALYINGVSESTATNSTAFSSTTNLIGARFNNSLASFAEFTNGYIDEFRVSDTARYTANFTPQSGSFANDENTVLLIHADGTDTSTTFTDDTTSTISSRTPKTFTANSGAALSTTSPQFGTASLYLDGTNDNVRSTTTYSDLQLISGDWTIEGWINTSDTMSEFLNYQDQGTNNGWAIGTRSSNRLLIVNGDGSTGLNVLLSSNDAWTTNTWTHFAFTYDDAANTISIYANGSRVAQEGSWSNPDANTAETMRIGFGNGVSSGLFNDGPYYYSGYLDEIRISTNVRYTGTTYTVPTEAFVNDANTVLLLHFDGTNSSTTITDDGGPQ